MVGLHAVFPGANLGRRCALNDVEQHPTTLNCIVFPAVSLFPQVEWSRPPHWQ